MSAGELTVFWPSRVTAVQGEFLVFNWGAVRAHTPEIHDGSPRAYETGIIGSVEHQASNQFNSTTIPM